VSPERSDSHPEISRMSRVIVVRIIFFMGVLSFRREARRRGFVLCGNDRRAFVDSGPNAGEMVELGIALVLVGVFFLFFLFFRCLFFRCCFFLCLFFRCCFFRCLFFRCLFSLDGIVNFSAVDWDFFWGGYAEAYFVSSDIDDCYFDVVAYHDAFVPLSA